MQEDLATQDELEGPLDLTLDNVEAVLDEMRPYLISDGGNVKVNEVRVVGIGSGGSEGSREWGE